MVAGQETGSATSSPPGSSVSLEPQRPKKDRRHTTQSPRSVRGSSLNASQEYQARLHRSHSATVSYEHGGSRSPFEGTESDTEDTWMDEYQSPATPQLSGFTFSSPPSRSTGYPSMPAASMPGFPPSQTAYGIGVGGHSNSGLGIFDGMPQYHPQQYPQADLSQYATTTATVGPSQVLYSHDVPVSSSGYSFTTAAPKRSSEPSWSPSF